YNSEEIVSRYDYDSTLYTNIDYDVAFSAGWEWDTPISKKWWVYYGADIGTFMQFENYEADNFDDGYAISTKTKDLRHSIGPFIGVRFDLTPRISLTTETNLKINFNTVDVHRTYTPTSSDYPELPDETDPTQKSLYTGYEVPYTLVLTIDL
ncbi:MAG TPA: hypothetical protein PKK72_14055, partial [Chitinophagales bacterium]|nr:hypothetical protein [Chitinophagales bacterium]HNM09708.1 hypothetical protein [Chitinophagales bacterium]HNM30974.1 hypothetical protein [Chitinophagales bacterium]HNO29966.1 hypothetical protein [Chitinophagales bacterium]